MMIHYLTAVDIANTVRMTRSLHKGAILIVEGDTDSRVYGRLVNSIQCKIIIAYGKDNSLNALQLLESDTFRGVLAIVDRDFWALENYRPNSPNVFFTDSHDLETMIFESPALDKILAEYGSEKKIDTFLRKLNKDLRTFILLSVAPIGFLRWYSLKERIALNFEGLAFSKFVDKTTLQLDVSKMIKTLKSHSSKPELKENELLSVLEDLSRGQYDLLQVCCGHDIVNFLTIGLLKVLGSHGSASLKPDEVGRGLRLAYEEAYFRSTNLCHALKRWQETNSPFVVA